MKNLSFLVVLFQLTFYVAEAQVGINNAMPDPNSILDVVSTDKGVLFPRMTTAQRTAMSDAGNVSNSLTVFDTDLNGYYFWDINQTNPNTGAVEPAWIRLLTEEIIRDNYVIVKRMSDFPADDADGSEDGVITLDTKTLYEINGTILVDKQININNAYISGLDTQEDRLINAISGAAVGTKPMFVGTRGGSLRNLIVIGTNGAVLPQPFFSIDTTSNPTDILLVTNMIFAGSAGVGSIQGLATVLFNVVQFQQNASGLIFRNNKQLFVTNSVWDSNNSGTYMSLVGSFDVIALSGGVVISDDVGPTGVSSGEIGLDVSGNPIIDANAILAGVSFSGIGDRVNPYPDAETYDGYNFTNKWAVNCPGIPKEQDDASGAGIGFAGGITVPTGVNATNGGNSYSGLEISFPAGEAMNTWKQISSGSFLIGSLFRFNHDTGVLTYEGNDPRLFTVNANISVSGGQSNDIYEFRFYKTPFGGTATQRQNFGAQRIDNTGDIDGLSFNESIQLEPGDSVEIRVARTRRQSNNSSTLKLASFNFSIN